MGRYTVTTGAAVGSGGTLSLAEAMALAGATPEADTIVFDPSVTQVRLPDTIRIDADGGPLVIDGDHDGDGVSDVFVLAAQPKRHLAIGESAEVTLKNLDFLNGHDNPRVTSDGSVWRPAGTGAEGAEATQAPGQGLDGGHANDDAGRGGDGMDGQDGPDAAGAIWNEGNLRLVRVGFGNNFADGHYGQEGGAGGDGGASAGGDGQSDSFPRNTPLPVPRHDATGRTVFETVPNTGSVPEPGGQGGNGGDGGAGGRGGRGGDGGDAAGAIFNAFGAKLVLQDVVFGGRMTSGILVEGNEARGGNGGDGGYGGRGGSSFGGDGGDGGVEWTRQQALTFGDPEQQSRYFAQLMYIYEAAPAGRGGNGGVGGRGGDAGNNGDGGAAATIVNRGTIGGTAAVPRDSDLPIVPELRGGTGGFVGIDGEIMTRPGNVGGTSHGGIGGREARDWYEAGNLVIGSKVGSEPGWREFIAPWSRPESFEFRLFYTAERADEGTDGANGLRGVDGLPGAPGRESMDVFNAGTGTGTPAVADALVYVHGLGQDTQTGQLAFNVIRIGDAFSETTVSWRLVGAGQNPVSGADFAGNALPTGRVTFGPMPLPTNDAERFTPDRTNVQRVEIAIAADGIPEPPEGYFFELLDATGTTSLGTARVFGTIIDAPGSGPLAGTPGRDTLDGGAGPDSIAGLAGDDILRGFDGADTLNGGDGADTLNGGDGADIIFGGDTPADLRDVIFGGAGNDRIDAGHGNDQVYGGEGDDTVEGGFGVDEIIGQGGNDVLTGSAFSDLIFGGDGNDFINGGFGSDRVNGGAGADRFYHLGIADHGSDWIQDYAAAEGDVLVWGGGIATRAQFQVNLTETAGAGAAGVDEAFVIYRPTGQILWALVDGGAQASINLQIGGQVFDLLA